MKRLIIPLVMAPVMIKAASAPPICYKAEVKEVDNVLVVDVEEAKCLATMVYGEARGESKKGKLAVAFTAANRAANDDSMDVCDVILAPKMYSAFNGNSKLRKVATTLSAKPKMRNEKDRKSWEESIRAAHKVLAGEVKDPTNGATHYYSPKAMAAKGYKLPRWARVYPVRAKIGNHIFLYGT